MAYLIKHRLAIYLDINSKDFYVSGHILRQLKKIDQDLQIPFAYKEAPIVNKELATLRELAPLDYDLNLVLLPNRLPNVHIAMQAQKIVIQMGFGIKEKGSYCTFSQRIRRYLKGEPLDCRWKSLFSYGTPYTKLIDICLMMDIADIKMFQILREQIKKLKIETKTKTTLLQILSVKELLLKRDTPIDEIQKRNHSIKFYGRTYAPIKIEEKQ